jgi:arylsulfatase A-like enzyme
MYRISLLYLAACSALVGCQSPPSTSEDSNTLTDDSAAPAVPAMTFADDERPRNILLISIDTLARNEVGLYGGGAATPFLDSLGGAGFTLDAHAAASSWTLPGMTSIVSGRDVEELPYVPRLQADMSTLPPLPDGTLTLAQSLADSGYRTACVSTVNFFGEAYGTTAGCGTLAMARDDAATVAIAATTLFDSGAVGGAEPWFAHVHFKDPHAPYWPPEAYRTGLEAYGEFDWDWSDEQEMSAASGTWQSGDAEERARIEGAMGLLYDAEARYLDDTLRDLLAELETRGELAETLVVVVNDHGEAFWEHGFRGHAGSLYAEENAAFALFSAPTLLPGQWNRPTNQRDLAPTLLDAVGLAVPEDFTGDVVGTAAPNRPVYAWLWPLNQPPIQAVRIGDDRLIYTWNGRKELYDLAVDPGELVDTYDPTSATAADLWDALTPRVEMLDALIDEFSPEGAGP